MYFGQTFVCFVGGKIKKVFGIAQIKPRIVFAVRGKCMSKDSVSELSAEERKAKFLKMAGIWSESEEGEEYYKMMKHRNDGRPANREVNLDD